MSEFPAPLVPAECSMSGNDWFPLHFDRLRKSKWWRRASDLARARNVMLWGEAYKQVPGGSMPDDDDDLAEAAGFGMDVESFIGAKAEIMAPWVLCSDGRWYHPTVCEVVLEAWERASERRKADALRKAGQRAKTRGQAPREPAVPAKTTDVTPDHAYVPPDTGENGRDIGTHNRQDRQDRTKDSDPDGSLPAAPPSIGKADLDQAWSAGSARGRERSSRKDVERALRAAANRGHVPADVIAGLRAYYASPDATKNDCEYAKGVHRMIENDRWKEHAPAPLFGDQATIEAPSEIRQRAWMAELRDQPNSWRPERGPAPGEVACRVTPEIQREFGVEPAKPQQVRGAA